MNNLERLARSINARTDQQLRLMYGIGTGVNTVTIDGSTTAVTLPAINAIGVGDYVAILGVGADRLILGKVT